MTEEFNFSTGRPSEEMASYIQMYLDETSEQLDALVETLLALEESPTHQGHLNEAFRLIHSIKGSSALMGLDSITVLTHHLENHFERLRSGLQSLDQPMMDLVLRCIDFLRECNHRLRGGEALASAPDLLEELGRHVGMPKVASPEMQADTSPPSIGAARKTADSTSLTESELNPVLPAVGIRPIQHWRITVRFEAGLQLADLKAELIVTRVSDLGELRGTDPPRDDLASVADSRRLQLLLVSERPATEIRAAADVGGVALVEIDHAADELSFDELALADESETVATESSPPISLSDSANSAVSSEIADAAISDDRGHDDTAAAIHTAETVASTEPRPRIVETVRVDIDRLDDLLNLAGELVVTNARFVQISRQMGPAFKKSGRTRAFGDSVRRLLEKLKSLHIDATTDVLREEWSRQIVELESEINAIETQALLWEEGRRCFGQISEAVNQLSRVSDSLQRGVLDTRMVPVGPLFNRFKRVVRDISHELGKQVSLEIQGEKTELDKRMIDELGDPLVHLVRNAIDHGLETPDLRLKRGKSELGTLTLEAIHSGNNVYIRVCDDGGGIDAARIRKKIVERGLVTADAASQLSDPEVIEFIWHPGLSTAEVVSDISGRGVGMDIVKTRIAELNGTISVDTVLGQGTTVSIRLPLTLAIIRCLLFRLRHGMFAVPIDGVREVVSVPLDEIVTIHGRHTFEVRGEFIPLVDIDDIFDWPGATALNSQPRNFHEAKRVNVVILQAMNETVGLRVDELQGGQDIVIKSLAENFVHIRGLSGASILGDGSICLLLDIAAAIDLAVRGRGDLSRRELTGAAGWGISDPAERSP